MQLDHPEDPSISQAPTHNSSKPETIGEKTSNRGLEYLHHDKPLQVGSVDNASICATIACCSPRRKAIEEEDFESGGARDPSENDHDQGPFQFDRAKDQAFKQKHGQHHGPNVSDATDSMEVELDDPNATESMKFELDGPNDTTSTVSVESLRTAMMALTIADDTSSSPPQSDVWDRKHGRVICDHAALSVQLDRGPNHQGHSARMSDIAQKEVLPPGTRNASPLAIERRTSNARVISTPDSIPSDIGLRGGCSRGGSSRGGSSEDNGVEEDGVWVFTALNGPLTFAQASDIWFWIRRKRPYFHGPNIPLIRRITPSCVGRQGRDLILCAISDSLTLRTSFSPALGRGGGSIRNLAARC